MGGQGRTGPPASNRTQVCGGVHHLDHSLADLFTYAPKVQIVLVVDVANVSNLNLKKNMPNLS